MQISLNELLQQIKNQPDVPDAIEKLFVEAKELPQLEHFIRALALFAQSLTAKGKYCKEGARYVLRPTNFVTFTLRHRRNRQVTISLRGNVKEFEAQSVLPIKDSRVGSYTECAFTQAKQLAAAAAYIQRAYEIYQKGSARTRKTVVRSEVPVLKAIQV